MLASEYQKLAGRTECNQLKSRERMMGNPIPADKPQDLQCIRLNHAVLGIAGEVGELAAAVERFIYYGKDLDVTNVKEELGDLCWYIAEACNALCLNLEDVMAVNILKLQVRYPEKFTEELAAEERRDRVKEREALDGVLERAQDRLKAWDKLTSPVTVDVDGRKRINNMIWECVACGHLYPLSIEICPSCSKQ